MKKTNQLREKTTTDLAKLLTEVLKKRISNKEVVKTYLTLDSMFFKNRKPFLNVIYSGTERKAEYMGLTPTAILLVCLELGASHYQADEILYHLKHGTFNPFD